MWANVWHQFSFNTQIHTHARAHTQSESLIEKSKIFGTVSLMYTFWVCHLVTRAVHKKENSSLSAGLIQRNFGPQKSEWIIKQAWNHIVTWAFRKREEPSETISFISPLPASQVSLRRGLQLMSICHLQVHEQACDPGTQSSQRREGTGASLHLVTPYSAKVETCTTMGPQGHSGAAA